MVAFSEDLDGSSDSSPSWVSAPREARERRAYFENSLGEQWIASSSPSLFRFALGDAGWKTIAIEQPDYPMLMLELADAPKGAVQAFRGVVVTSQEIVWLKAVVGAALP